MATGLLPVLVGEATKLTPYLMGLEKVYQATARLGLATDTYDTEGRVVAEAHPAALAAISVERVERELARFTGRIRQRPPVYSAIKQGGRRLYELARAEEEVEVAEREVVVHAIELRRFRSPEVDLVIRCGKGTYVRSIAHDLGVALGVGAHLCRLRRTRIGDLEVEAAVDVFADGTDLGLAPPGRAVAHLPALTVDAEAARRLRMGQQAALANLMVPPGAPGAIRLLDPGGELVAIAEATSGALVLARVFRGPA
jgi:tRNA pseudouridine55 synthase